MTTRTILGALILGLAAAPATAAPWPADAQVILVEGEDYTGSYNSGGFPIGVAFCGSASGYYAVDGVDQPGEWIELPLALPASRCYWADIGVQAWPGEAESLRLSLFPAAGGPAAASADCAFTGGGVGCEYPYLWTVGEPALCVGPGVYRARIELLAGTLARIDRLRLTYDDTPVAAGSWSRVKSLY